ncbi:hypothetical protein F383_21822 [Gossypium arboreum]|uniref:Uncharacterized protein n=1 Tax=Gossypium arboreum TaxID=29729 RepID=A0A0B0NT97_GOSAR|nr:hypothetical protein F383_21822 [Gossypium arboreum]
MCCEYRTACVSSLCIYVLTDSLCEKTPE